jgi:hypothetical protein
MKNRVQYLILAAVLLMSLASFASVSAQPTTHALVHITNRSNARATVYFKWGNGPWRKAIIEIGQRHWFNHAYDGQNKTSPNFYVRLDVDTQGVRYVEHILSRGQSPDESSPNWGHHFTIKQLTGTDTRYIQATTSGAWVRVTDTRSSRPNLD